jgi:four helix bundle protein
MICAGTVEMNAEELKERTRQFAHRCVKLALALPDGFLGDHVKRQLIRSATSVASNYRAACLAQSKAHFTSKLSIVVEEADECVFWMEFSVEEKLIDEKRVASLLNEARELAAMFIAARKTTKDRSHEFESGAEPAP